MSIRIRSTCFAAFLLSICSFSDVFASPFEIRTLCDASAWIVADECKVAETPARVEQDRADEIQGLFGYDSSSIIRLVTPFSWNFADAFDTVTVEPTEPALLNLSVLPQVLQQGAYCELGCSATLASVPESASMVLLGGALLLLGAVVRGWIGV